MPPNLRSHNAGIRISYLNPFTHLRPLTFIHPTSSIHLHPPTFVNPSSSTTFIHHLHPLPSSTTFIHHLHPPPSSAHHLHHLAPLESFISISHHLFHRSLYFFTNSPQQLQSLLLTESFDHVRTNSSHSYCHPGHENVRMLSPCSCSSSPSPQHSFCVESLTVFTSLLTTKLRIPRHPLPQFRGLTGVSRRSSRPPDTNLPPPFSFSLLRPLVRGCLLFSAAAV